MIKNLKHWVESNFNTIFIMSFLCGLFLPELDTLPHLAELASIAMGIVVFFCCAKINTDEIKQINIKRVKLFYIIRFVLLPIIVWYICDTFLGPNLAIGMLLFFLMPAGISATSVTKIMGGNITLALGITVLSSLLVPFIVSAIFSLIEYKNIDIDVLSIFQTLCLMIFVPLTCYFFIAKPVEPIKKITKEYAQFGSVVFVGFLMAFVIADQREEYFSDPLFLIEAFILTSTGYFIFYAMGWFTMYRATKKERLAYTVSSGVNNTSLGIIIAALYFDYEVVMLLLFSEIAFTLAIPIFGYWYKKK